MSDTPKPYHWGKADARFFVAQDDVENRGWGVFEMGADVPILFWCASKADAETAALRLNHINEQFLTCRRSQLDPKPVDTGGVEGGGAVVLEGELHLQDVERNMETFFDIPFIDGEELGELLDTHRRALEPWKDEGPQPPSPFTHQMTTKDFGDKQEFGPSFGPVRITIEPLTEKPSDSMGGGKDKENGRSDDLRDATDEVGGSRPSTSAELKRQIDLYGCAATYDGVLLDPSRWALHGMTGRWQSMDSAPNDTWIIVTDGSEVMTTKIDRHRRELLIGEWGWTRWMGLPQAPKDSAASDTRRVSDSINPTPLGQPTTNPTENPSDLDAPQPEKREGPAAEDVVFVDFGEGVMTVGDEEIVFRDPSNENLSLSCKAARAAYLAGQRSQPEGDERLLAMVDDLIDDFADDYLIRLGFEEIKRHTSRKLKALRLALGSGEGDGGGE